MASPKFEPGDIVRRSPYYDPHGVWPAEMEVLACTADELGGLTIRGELVHAPNMTDKLGNSPGWDAAKFALVRPARSGARFNIKAAQRVLSGEYTTLARGVAVSWSDSDGDGDVRVTIDRQYMSAADLDEAAELFKELCVMLRSTPTE